MTVSILAHLAAAGAVWAVVALAPPEQPPALLEIPVELVFEPPASASVQIDQAARRSADEPIEAEPAAPDDEAPAPASTEAVRSIAEEAPPAEPDMAATREPAADSPPADEASRDEITRTGAEEAPPPAEESDVAVAREPPADNPLPAEAPAVEPSAEAAGSRDDRTREKPLVRSVRQAQPLQPRAIPKPAPAPEKPEKIKAADRDAERERAMPRRERAAEPQPRVSARMPERRSERGSAAAEGARSGAARAESGPRPQGRAAAAPPAAFAAVSPAAASSYRGQAIAHLTRFKRYPSGAELRGAEGTPVVSFSLDGGGRVVAVALARSSGHADIDAETVAMVRRAAPFPAPPAGAPQAISAAISFQLR